jgi:hypothetical protein
MAKFFLSASIQPGRMENECQLGRPVRAIATTPPERLSTLAILRLAAISVRLQSEMSLSRSTEGPMV